MRTRIVRIGNSQGIRLPKLYLQQTGLGEEVEIEAQDREIHIRPAVQPRSGWAEAFSRMAQQGDDRLFNDAEAIPSRWDEEEWQW